MALREPYHEYVLVANPLRHRGRWIARIIIELHEHGAVHFQRVCDDPFVTYPSREEAERASIEFGKTILDSRRAARAAP